jgi:hypothetical protein
MGLFLFFTIYILLNICYDYLCQGNKALQIPGKRERRKA